MQPPIYLLTLSSTSIVHLNQRAQARRALNQQLVEIYVHMHKDIRATWSQRYLFYLYPSFNETITRTRNDVCRSSSIQTSLSFSLSPWARWGKLFTFACRVGAARPPQTLMRIDLGCRGTLSICSQLWVKDILLIEGMTLELEEPKINTTFKSKFGTLNWMEVCKWGML